MKHLIPVPDTQTADEAWTDIKLHRTLDPNKVAASETTEWQEIECEELADCPYCNPIEEGRNELEGTAGE